MNSDKPKAILITGCSSGIGLHAAETLQRRGYQVISTCRSAADVEPLRERGLHHALQLDLADSASVQRGAEAALEMSQGKLFALFNNGAYGLPGALEDISRDALRRQFEVNVFGTHELTRRLIPHLLQLPDARIIQNSSVLGIIAAPNRGAYIASKYALEGLSDTLRLELYGSSIKCILIEPGPITSRFRDNALRAFEREVDSTNSRHAQMYQQALQRLQREGQASSFTLGPQAVTECLIKALESPRPRVRYRVTKPTSIMAILRRVLSSRALDAFLRRFAKP